MAEKYRAGIIGCGSIANYHARGYQGVEEIEIVALEEARAGLDAVDAGLGVVDAGVWAANQADDIGDMVGGFFDLVRLFDGEVDALPTPR